MQIFTYNCKRILSQSSTRVGAVVNSGQNLVNVVCERPPNASCSLDFKAVTIVKSVKVSINQLSPTGPWRQLWEVTWYKLMVSSPLECWELFATWYRCLCWNLLPSKGLSLLNKLLPDGFDYLLLLPGICISIILGFGKIFCFIGCNLKILKVTCITKLW